MTNTARKLDTGRAPSLEEVFIARAEARAYLWAHGEIPDLPEAVDVLQADAVRAGLVTKLGQDEAQRIMAEAFAAMHGPYIEEVPEPEPWVFRVARKTSGPRAAGATVEALMFSLRERGEAALAEPACRARLAELSKAQAEEITTRLMRLRSRYPAITDELLFQVGEQIQ